MTGLHSPDTRLYFDCSDLHLWRWENDDALQAAVWGPEGTTLIVREELQPLLRACAPADLPPLGALMLVVAAACDSYNQDDLVRRLQAAFERASGDPALPAPQDPLGPLITAGLMAVHRLPARLRASGPPRWRLCRTLFAEATFEWAGPSSETIARRILLEFEGTPSVEVFRKPDARPPGRARLLRELAALSLAFQRCPPEALEARLETGIDGLPSAGPGTALSDLLDPQADLLAALEREGGEMASVAGLVRRLNAVLHLPHPLDHRDDLPVGGVSDITNRGEPSRLLLTELAFDDLTFAARLAHGEALYLRREAPPAAPPPQRTVLLDTGIFLWGIPRLMAVAGALSLLRPKPGAPPPGIQTFLLAQQSAHAIALDSPEDVRECLRTLDPAPHPAEALGAFTDHPSEASRPGQTVLLITHAAALALLENEPVWSRLLDRAQVLTLVVDRHGSFELSSHAPVGRRLLSRLHVDPDTWLQGVTGPMLNDPVTLPRFYQQNPWPLCYPGLPSSGQAFAIGTRGLIGITPNGCACWWPPGSGAGHVLSPGPHPIVVGKVVLETAQSDSAFVLFQSTPSKPHQILVLSLDGKRPPFTLPLPSNARRITDLRVQSGALIVTCDAGVLALAPENGRVLEKATLSLNAGTPWFDGERFHPLGEAGLAANHIATRPQKLPAFLCRRNCITAITMAGFGRDGGLFIASPHGRTYTLDMYSDNLAWKVVDPGLAPLQALLPVTSTALEYRNLKEARFLDGRRIIHDPRGWIHVCEPRSGAELTVSLARGHTAAWDVFGLHFGDPVLHCKARPGTPDRWLRLTSSLLRPWIPSLPPIRH